MRKSRQSSATSSSGGLKRYKGSIGRQWASRRLYPIYECPAADEHSNVDLVSEETFSHPPPPRISRHSHSEERNTSNSFSGRPNNGGCNGHCNDTTGTTLRIPITPTLSMPLRSAIDTLACIENDLFVPTSCLACRADIFCITDANFVLCPSCRSVGPLSEGAIEKSNGVVGLGFTYDDLREIQSLAFASRRNVTAAIPSR